MDDGYAPVLTPEEEEEERRRQGNYSPISASALHLNGAPTSAEPSPDASLAVASPNGAGTLKSLKYEPSSSATMPPVQPPAQARLKALVDKGMPPVQPLHRFKRVLDTIGQIVAPKIEERFRYRPQADYARQLSSAEKDVAAEQAPEAAQTKTNLEAAQTDQAKARAESLRNPKPPAVGQTGDEVTLHDLMTGDNGNPRMNAKTGKPYSYLEAYQEVQNAKNAAVVGAKANPWTKEKADQFNKVWDPILKKHGLPTGQFHEGMPDADAKELSSGFNNILGKQQGDTRIVIQQEGEKTKEKAATRQVVRDHDKAYVQPAEAVEKSYQMMDRAYQDYKTAQREGKELPTGAESMLALSTHLSTTFGNVKGARVTKDMIQHHLGARGISDSALIAVQKLTNGDVLSPDQWEAFHKLIRESRDLSWGTAIKEAKRKEIPVDFLPEGSKEEDFKARPADQPERPANVPAGYVHKDDGPKGPGWYKP